MVRITRQNVQQQSRRRGTGSGLDDALQMARAKLLEKDSLVGVLIVLSAGLLFVVYMLWSSASDGNLRADAGEGHPNLHFEDRDSEQYNAIALDIRDTLDCHLLLNSTKESYPLFTEGEGIDSKEAAQSTRRRLTEDVEEDAQAKLGEDERRFGLDDDMEMMDGVVKNPTAKHLFCLAAYASDDRKETGQWKDMIKCDATGSAQRSLLDLWSMAQGEMTPDLLLKVLDMSVENLHTIIKKDLNLWAPREDTGLDYMVTHVNEEEKTVDQGGLYGLDQYLGKDKVFVDVGSCLGTTSMAISLLYPGTRVVSIESASPNWLLQEINFRCNADAFEQQPLIMLSGVGPAHSNSAFARYTWKSDQVTSARAWTPQQEINPVKDIELAVKLRPWHSILAEAEIIHDSSNRAKIDVLNVDCGACEYNLIPSMTDAEFDSITTVMGGVHWGYIPKAKLPSSSRGKETHQRLCKHENFARTAKECCQFPNMEVISSYPDHVLVEHEEHPGIGRAGTVAAVAGDLCNDYSAWAVEKHVNDIESDWGWFRLTASAKDE